MVRPYLPIKVRERISEISEMKVGLQLTRGQQGAIIGVLDKLCHGPNFRHFLLYWLFPDKWERWEDATSKDLSKSEWFALNRWVQPYKSEEGWVGADELEKEVRDVLNAAIQFDDEAIYSLIRGKIDRRTADEIIEELGF